MKVSLTSLRTRLALLVLLAVIPAMSLVVWTAAEQRRDARTAAQDDALRMARTVAAQQDDWIDGTRQLLLTLAQMPAVRAHDADACSALFVQLHRDVPRYTNLWASTPDGNAFCSSAPHSGLISNAASEWFKRTLRDRTFTVGEYQIGRVSGKPIVSMAYPILDEEGGVQAVVAAGLDLDRLNRLDPPAWLPARGALTIVDRNGTILVRQPKLDAWTGKRLPQDQLVRELLARAEGTATARGLDGEDRLYGFTTLGAASGGVHVLVGMPTAVAYADANQTLIRNLTALGIVTLLALAAAWLGGDLFVLQRMRALVQATERVAAGDLSARVPISGVSEIARAGTAFNVMVESLSETRAELTRQNENLRMSEERLARMFETMTDGVLLLDRDGRFTLANPAVERILGLQRTGLAGTPYTMAPLKRLTLTGEPLPEEDYPFVRVRNTHQPVRGVEFAVERPDGEWIVLSANGAPLFDAAGDFAGMVASFTDITERRQAEERLHATMAALEIQYEKAERAASETRAVLDATSEAIVLVSPDRRFLSVNRRCTEMFGFAAEATLGRRFHKQAKHDHPSFADPTVRARFYDAAADAEEVFTETVRQVWPVARELELYSTPVRTADGGHLGRLYVFRDVTREREVDRMKSEFVSLVSHELRTPLTSIKGYVDLLIDGEVGDLQHEQAEFLGIVRTNANALVALINDLLDVSRIEAGKIELQPAIVDLHHLVHTVVDSLRPLVDAKGQAFAVELPDRLPAVWADPARLTQIVTNLLSNACKYTPAGGRITLSAQSGAGGRVEVAVADTGIGLTPEEQTRLFTRFFRARNRATEEAGGTGLGLAITRALVELHGGTIAVESTPGRGSTFWFTLPVSAEPAASTANPATARGPDGRILVAVSEPDIARLVLDRVAHSLAGGSAA